MIVSLLNGLNLQLNLQWDYNRKQSPKQNILEKNISHGPSANLKPLFNSNVAKVSVLSGLRIEIGPSEVVYQHTTSDGSITILRSLYNRYFCHITIEKWCQMYTRTIRKCFFEDTLFLGAFHIVIPSVNSISNLDHKGVELSC